MLGEQLSRILWRRHVMIRLPDCAVRRDWPEVIGNKWHGAHRGDIEVREHYIDVKRPIGVAGRINAPRQLLHVQVLILFERGEYVAGASEKHFGDTRWLMIWITLNRQGAMPLIELNT